MSIPVLELKGFNATSSSGNLYDISFSVESGEVFAVFGESGSGKSTLVQSIGRNALSRDSFSGEIFFGGEPSVAISDSEFYRDYGGRYVATIPHHYEELFSPVEKIGLLAERLSAPGYCDLGRHELNLFIKSRFESLGLPRKILNSYHWELDRGELFKSLLAIVSLRNPQIVIIDSAVDQVDVTVQKSFAKMAEVLLGRGWVSSILLCGQNLPLLVHTCQRGVVLYEGRVVEAGLIRGIIESPEDEYTKGVLQRIRRVSAFSKGRGEF